MDQSSADGGTATRRPSPPSKIVTDLSGIGVVCTGYMEKKNPNALGVSWQRRFLVLTHESLHWFKREAGSELFGEERGMEAISNIETVKLLASNKDVFELCAKGGKRQFRVLGDGGSQPNSAEEWVHALNQCMAKCSSSPKRRTATLSNIRPNEHQKNRTANFETLTVGIVSVRRSAERQEVVIARNPAWERMILVSDFQPGDELLMSTSNGGVACVNFDTLQQNETEGGEFDVTIEGGAIHTSLRMSVVQDPGAAGGGGEVGAASANVASTNSGSPLPSRKIASPSTPGSTPGGRVVSAASPSSWLFALPKDGASTVTLLLSLMALLVGAYSLDQVGPNTILLFLCCLLLALNGLYQSRATKPELGVVSSLSPGVGVGMGLSGGGGAGVGEGVVLGVGKNFRIVLHSHSFASARTKGDAIVSGGEASAGDSVGMAMGDGGETAEEAEDASNTIPKRFIDGCEGNMKEARRRWDITSKWRREERVDDILNERQPHFRKIKEHYPHFNSGRGKAGHAIYWERPGEIALEPLLKAGIKTDDLCRHWIFVTEFQWAVLCKGDETAKSIAVIDVKGVGIWDLVGPKLECVKKCVGMANQHYPERSLVVYFVNASWFFTAVWGAIKPWVHPNTQRKVRRVFFD